MSSKVAQKYAILQPLTFDEIKGWDEDNHLEALHALKWSAKRTTKKPYKTKELGIDGAQLTKTLEKLLEEDCPYFENQKCAKTFFEDNFTPHLITSPDATNIKDENAYHGFVTAYFEPEVEASTVQTERFKFPILKCPTDLVAITDEERPSTMGEEFYFARKTTTPNGVEFSTFPNRHAIENGALEGQDLEIFWFESKVDIFFIHIQGSARLRLVDCEQAGQIARISYDGKSGHAFTPIGRILIERNEIAREDITMQSIRDWLFAHPHDADALMYENESFIFFQIVEHPAPNQKELGPVAAAGVPLSPLRSLAVDHRLQTFGVPIFISTQTPIGQDEQNFQKLMVAQDTGSAIVGAARGDIFIGTGKHAEDIAGAVKHPAHFIVLLPNGQL
ncbi:MAG: murein transglycosylase A [Nitratireductor sp.]